jgi:hypothetical protein
MKFTIVAFLIAHAAVSAPFPVFFGYRHAAASRLSSAVVDNQVSSSFSTVD